MSPLDAIQAGRSILDPLLIPAGFRFVAGEHGPSSGGHFAAASYINGDKRLAFSYRYALGMVVFYVGDTAISHDGYMTFLGKSRSSAFCWYSPGNPMSGFDALRKDLELFCRDFVFGTGDEIRAAADALR